MNSIDSFEKDDNTTYHVYNQDDMLYNDYSLDLNTI